MPYALRAALLVLIYLAVGVLHAGDSGDAPKVAVIRVMDAMNGSKSLQARMESYKQDALGYQAEMKKFADNIQKLQNNAEALTKGSDRWSDTQLELEKAKANREAFAGWWEKELERRYMIVVQDEYTVLRDTLAAFCKQRSIKIVVQAASKEISAPNRFLTNMRLEGQVALFWDADQDITDAYVGFANQRWAERVEKDKGAAPAPSTPPSTPAQAPQPNGAP